MLDRRRWPADVLALLAGLALPAAFAPLQWAPLAIVCVALLWWIWDGADARRALRRGYWFGLGMFGVGVWWVFVAIHDFGFTSAPVATLLTLLFVAFLALFPALLGFLAVRLMPAALRQNLALRYWAWFPLWWVLFEWIRSWFMTGFPWLSLGYAFIDTPPGKLAPVFGVFGVSLAVALSAGGLLYALHQRGGRGLISLLGVALIWASGWGAGQLHWSEPVGQPLKVSLVQGSLPQLTKWDAERIAHRLQHYADLSEPLWASNDLIIWPENALTIYLRDAPPGYVQTLRDKAKRNHTDLILGVPHLNEETREYYSSLMVIGAEPGIYHKRHLVPFGEYVPLEAWLRGLIGFFDLPRSGFSAGSDDQLHLVAAGQPLAPTICYEDAFGDEVIDFLPRATLLVNGSNNAWYGDSWAPHQHLQIARMRALETSRPLMRATTNGISAFVDHKGRIIKRSRQFEPAVLSAEVQPRQGTTPYVRWGNTPVLILVGVVLLGVGLVMRFRSR